MILSAFTFVVEVMFNLRTFSQALATVIKLLMQYFVFRNLYKFSECGKLNLIIKHFCNILFIQTKKIEKFMKVFKMNSK